MPDLTSALQRLRASRHELKYGWVKDPALPWWHIHAKGCITKDGEEIIRRYWVRRGQPRVSVEPGDWYSEEWIVKGVPEPMPEGFSTWRIDRVLDHIDRTWPLKKTRSDIDRVVAYQEAFDHIGQRRRKAKNGIHLCLLHIYFGWREVMIQMGRDPMDFDTFCLACGRSKKIMFTLICGRAKSKHYTLKLLTRVQVHFSWYMTRYNGPGLILSMRPDLRIFPTFLWPDPMMDETTDNVIDTAKLRHQKSRHEGGFVRWSPPQVSHHDSLLSRMTLCPDLDPTVSWHASGGSAGTTEFVQLTPEARRTLSITEPTEWEEIGQKDFPRMMREVFNHGAFTEEMFADEVGTTPLFLKRFWAGRARLSREELGVWISHLKPVYCPQPEMKKVRGERRWRWRLHPAEPV